MVILNPGGGGGGGAHSSHILVRMCCGKVKNGGLWSELERENGGLRNGLCKMRLAVLWPAANPERFAFGLAAVSRPWAVMNGLNVKKF